MIIIAKKNTIFKLEMMILASLVKKDCYGYEISQTVKEKTNGVIEIKEGVMYPLLHGLLENEYITSFEEIVNRRIRVYYHIEDKGKQYLKELIDEFLTKVKTINHFLNELEDR